MGCASSKKRTTSVDDLTGGDKKDLSAPSKKNGQLASNDAKHRAGAGDASNAMQIPGAHTSFMAPDGIPFIDEDVPDEDATTATRKPEVNRNMVQAEQAKPVAAMVPAASEKPSLAPSELKDQKDDKIGAEIMKREIEMTQNTTTTTGRCITCRQSLCPALW